MKKVRTCSVMGMMLVGLGVLGEDVARSAIVFDQSPEKVGGTLAGEYVNFSSGQNFGEELMSLAQPTSITGLDIYTSSSRPGAMLGESVTVRIWADSGGTPGALLYDFTELISIVDTDGIGTFSDTVRVHADFTSSLSLGAGDYWIGMSGTTLDVGQVGINGGSGPGMDGKMAQFLGSSFTQMTQAGVGDSAIRVWGEEEDVIPEPSTIAIWSVLGFVGLGGVAWRRRKRIAA